MSDLSAELLTALRTLLDAGDEGGARRLIAAHREWYAQAAGVALQAGRPRLAALWAEGHAPLLHAAALLRLGEAQATLHILEAQPRSARVQTLRARAKRSLPDALEARESARQEGDGPALVAAVTLLGELLLTTDPKAALLALAEGLKVAELLNAEADAHLLAVLAHVQARLPLQTGRGGSGKAAKTAQKALERSAPRSPARVLALLSLGRGAEAEAERVAGALSAGLFEIFLKDSALASSAVLRMTPFVEEQPEGLHASLPDG